MISMLKDNSVTIFVEAIPFDKKNDINSGIEGYGLYEIAGIIFDIVDYHDPET
jgi:hypothetical protein